MLTKLRKYISSLRHLSELDDRFAAMDQRMDDRFGAVNPRLDWTDKRLDEAERLIRLIRSADKTFLETAVYELSKNDDLLIRINKELSIRPVIWGNPERLHISPLAAVFTCVFNTNSGEITIGDYTFAGSGVSILAGTHDKNLTGLLRRDAEATDGCDIIIEKGVWLGSNSVILGPCKICENAVIAAGAVVTPGTIVPVNTVYGGVPAKEITVLHTVSPGDMDSIPIKKALERNDGILFSEGWSEKKIIPECSCNGHYLIAAEGAVLTNRNRIQLVYSRKKADENSVTLTCDEMSKTIALNGTSGETVVRLPFENENIHEIRIRAELPEDGLLISLLPFVED